jgi:hypothetical protein
MPEEAQAATAAADTSAQKPEPVGITSEQLKGRLDEERAKGRNAVLKELGFEKYSDLQTALKLAKEMQDSQLSEREKLEQQIKELSPRAKRAEKYEKLLASVIAEQFSALPENVRTAIDEQAKEDPEERLRLMSVMKAAGLIGQAANSNAQKGPATTAPPGAPAPRPVRSKWDEHQGLLKAGRLAQADIFYAANALDIQRSRPADQ